MIELNNDASLFARFLMSVERLFASPISMKDKK